MVDGFFMTLHRIFRFGKMITDKKQHLLMNLLIPSHFEEDPNYKQGIPQIHWLMTIFPTKWL
jgi:hypothetical protein